MIIYWVKLNPLGVITLEESVEFSDEIQPVCPPSLTDDKDDYAGYNCTVAGWGTTRSPGGGKHIIILSIKTLYLRIILDSLGKHLIVNWHIVRDL